MNNFENYFNMMNPMKNWAKGADSAKMWEFWTDSFNELKKMGDPTAVNFNQNFIELQQKMMKSYTETMDNFVKSSPDGGECLSFFKEYTNLFTQNLEKMQKMALETSKTCQDDIVKKCKTLEKQVIDSMEEYKNICNAHKTDASINLHVDYVKNSINTSISNMQDMLKMASEASLKAANSATDIAKDTYKEMQESFCEVKKEKKK
jgi:hypothetical protein